MQITKSRFLFSSIAAVAGVLFVIFGLVATANNDVVFLTRVWKAGLTEWSTSISVVPGERFVAVMLGSYAPAEPATLSLVSMSHELPLNTTYELNSSKQIRVNGADWTPLSDTGISPFVGTGVSIGTLSQYEAAQYKYNLVVDNFLPAGTTSLAWQNPVLNFTDANGAQTKQPNDFMSITIASGSLPAIDAVSINTKPIFIVGDSIDITASGSAGKIAHAIINGTITVLLAESPVGSGAYAGSYVINVGDDMSSSPVRVYFDNGNGTGAYKDAAATITADATLPPAFMGGITATFDPTTFAANIAWTPTTDSEVAGYALYWNNGDLNADIDYTTPFATIPDTAIGSFNTGEQGITLGTDKLYEIGIRSLDASGNSDGNIDQTTSFATDITPPEAPASLLFPPEGQTNVMVSPIAFQWGASANTAGDLGSYTIEVSTDPGFGVITAASTQTNPAATTSDLIALGEGIYYWRVSALDVLGNASDPLASTAAFEIDGIDPTGAITTPVAGAYIGDTFSITGTAQDAGAHINNESGIALVEIIFFRFGSPAHYWNGTDWISGAETFVPVTQFTQTNGVVEWQYDVNVTNASAGIQNGQAYFIGARITDNAGHVVLEPSNGQLISLIGATIKPTVAINQPSSTFIGGNALISGTTTDSGGSGIASVNATIQRSTDSFYYDAASNVWQADVLANTANTTDNFTTWSMPISPDATLADGSIYTVSVTATDNVFGIPHVSNPVSVSLSQDTTDPTISVSSITAESAFRAATFPVIAGTATDGAGAGVSDVGIAIRDSAGNYWNQSAWVVSAKPIYISTAPSSPNNFSSWTYPYTPNKEDRFTLFYRVTDKAVGAPNVLHNESAGIAFAYDNTAPVISNITLTNDTVAGIMNLVKNGNQISLSATIADLLQADINVSDITADLSTILLDTDPTAGSVQPTSYNSANGATAWPFKTVADTGNGAVLISVTVTDKAGNGATASISVDTDNTAPAISALSLPSTVFAGSTTHAISYTTTDAHFADLPITLEYTTDGTNYTAIAQNIANTSTQIWTLPAINSNTVLVRLTAKDKLNQTSISSYGPFTIDSEAPQGLALISPNGGEAWKQGTEQVITWNASALTDNFNLATNPVSLEYYTSSLWVVIAEGLPNTGSYNWTVPTIDETTVRIRITANDEAGNASNDASDANFAIGLPPVVVSARAISETQIEITWNKPIANAGAFASYTATGITAIAAAVHTDPAMVILTIVPLNNTGFTASDLAISAGTVTDTTNFINEAASSITIADAQKPRAFITKVLALPGNDFLVVTFSEDVATSTAETVSNYTLQAPIGTSVSFTNAQASYANRKVIIELDQAHTTLVKGDVYAYSAQNVSDVRNNTMIPTVSGYNSTGPLVEAGVTITEIVTNAQQDWSSANFTGTPGGSGSDDDKYLELYINQDGLNLNNWSISTSVSSSSGGVGTGGVISSPGGGGGGFGGAFNFSHYTGTGTAGDTRIGDVVVVPMSGLTDNMQILIQEENGIIVDGVTFGSYNDGNMSDSAPSSASTALYNEAIARNAARTDTDTDNLNWHPMRATPGFIDTTAPIINLANVFPQQNLNLPDRAPHFFIPLIESGSGVRNDVSVDASYANQIVFTLDGVEQTETYDPATQVLSFIPASALALGKHTASITVRDNAGNTSQTYSWDFWADTFTVALASAPIHFQFEGNSTDQTDASEQQHLAVSTYGAGYTVYARFASNLLNAFNTVISGVSLWHANDLGTLAALNGATLVPVATVAKPAIPVDTISTITYTFDAKATIPQYTQQAGDYNGVIEFVVVPEF